MRARPTRTWRPPLPVTILAQGFARTGGHDSFSFLRDGGPATLPASRARRYGPLQSLGDMSDEKVKRDMEAVMKDAIGFFEKYVLA